ncbi:MAG: cytochrome b [Telluria sp.]
MQTAQSDRYSGTAIALHWLIALLIVIAFSLGWIVSEMHGLSPAKLRYVSWHKWLGVTVLWLAAVRLLWRLFRPAPAYVATLKPWERTFAHWGHILLYILMFAVPITGYFMSSATGVPIVYFGLFELPTFIAKNRELHETLEDIHGFLAWTLFWVVLLHVAAALKHHFIDHDGTLRRMLPHP